jgi:hypothetical protein
LVLINFHSLANTKLKVLFAIAFDKSKNDILCDLNFLFSVIELSLSLA